jgi:hypothetical protein
MCRACRLERRQYLHTFASFVQGCFCDISAYVLCLVDCYENGMDARVGGDALLSYPQVSSE